MEDIQLKVFECYLVAQGFWPGHNLNDSVTQWFYLGGLTLHLLMVALTWI